MSGEDDKLLGGRIVRLNLSVGRDLPERTLSMTEDFQRWIYILAKEPDSDQHLLKPSLQFRELCRHFVAGEPLTDQGDFKKIRRHPRHVFEFRTPELRIFGWVTEKDHFVCCFGDTIYRLKPGTPAAPGKRRSPDKYGLYCQKVVKIRLAHGMPCIQSEDLNDHFTNIVR